MRSYLPVLVAIAGLGTVNGQLELRPPNYNTNFQAGAPNVASPPPTSGQNASVVNTSGGVGALSDTGSVADQYPSNPAGDTVLKKAIIGSPFAAGVPRYALGDEITSPRLQWDGATEAPPGYWRKKPVFPGEVISGIGTPVPAGTVNVTTASNTSPTVVVDSVPSELVVGSYLLGQPVTRVIGTTVTLAGNASTTISGTTSVSVTPATDYYYSPHAEKVFAHQPGRVTITWVTAQQEGGSFRTVEEIFAVSANTGRAIRTIFWTEGTFDGPKVQVNDGSITTINPVFNRQVPKAVPEEVSIPGYNPISPNLTTISFEKFNGVGELKAYNVEGRVLIEYLGEIRDSAGAHEFLGLEIVEIKRVPPIGYPSVNLGQEILPSRGGPDLIASPVLNSQQGGVTFYGTSVRPDQTLAYFAERETSIANDPDDGSPNNPNEAFNKVVFYWLEEGNFGITWPTHQDRYWLRWSPNLDDYAHYTVDDSGSTVDTGVSFTGGVLPQLIYQDDPAQAESVIDINTQRFHINYLGPDERNRSLLKFTSNGEVWYVVMYSQGEGRAKVVSSTTQAFDDRSIVTTPTTIWLAPGNPVSILSVGNLGTNVAEVIDGTRYRLGFRYLDSFLGYHEFLIFIYAGWPYNGFYLLRYDGWVTNPSLPTSTIVNVASTAGLEVGMVVTGTGIIGDATISRIIDETTYELSTYVAGGGTHDWTYTVESDQRAFINTFAFVGSRILPPVGHEAGGYISDGTGYYPEGYVDPFVAGVPVANEGAIIPVNAVPGNEKLTVRWFKRVKAPNSSFQDFFVPGKTGRYTSVFPTFTIPEIVIAQGVGTDDLPPELAAGSVYYQNDDSQPGYNPNEEHALMLAGRAYALRDDLNVVSGPDFTSLPCILLAYTDSVDGRPAMKAYNVKRSNAYFDFDYTATAGTLLVKPYPLPLMPLALEGTGTNRRAKDFEIQSADDPTNETRSQDTNYTGFTFQDRKGFTWVHRGAHQPKVLVRATYGVTGQTSDVTAILANAIANGWSFVVDNFTMGGDPAPGQAKTLTVSYDMGSGVSDELITEGGTFTPPPPGPTLSMQLYYLNREGFYFPGFSPQPEVDTILPFLRNPSESGTTLDLDKIDNGEDHEPLTVVYRPTWPADAPELRIAESLMLPKFGLPQVRGQSSAQILYQQSIANAATTTGDSKRSVTLHDPTREKTVAIDAPSVGLTELPSVLMTTNYQGKVYFQGLPPHLQERFFFDPLRGDSGTLILLGEFHDVPAGEDYLDINLLSAADETAMKDLIPVGNADKSKWEAAINALTTTVETFIENPNLEGDFIVDAAQDEVVGENDLAIIDDPDTAVDSYALTATGQGTGFVTMAFGNGNVFTDEGDPVQIQVFKVAPQLYVGDLKTLLSENPLDEQVSLRHSGDYGGKPEEYEFDWRWTTGAATAPAVYTQTMEERIGDQGASPASHEWKVIYDPRKAMASSFEFDAALAFPFPRTMWIKTGFYTAEDDEANYPTTVMKSTVGLDFTEDGVPGRIVFSANLGALDGFILYVNGKPALAHQAPEGILANTNASSGLTPNGLSKQFSVAPSFFSAGLNRIEMALYSEADVWIQSNLDFMLEVAEEVDAVEGGSVWQIAPDPTEQNKNIAIVGGSPLNPFGGPTFVLNDRWFTMRYRPKLSAEGVWTEGAATQEDVEWSRWTNPMLVEGWIKRVLAAINPFEQRVKDLFSNEVNTDVSVLTQAGTRWEGDIALNLDNINEVGLIEIYETVLNRGKSMSIDANTNDPDTNNALLLAAGYLSDLYTLLGNEAFADAANPTISIDDQGSSTQVNTSRFSFEAQVASSLDEELALLRGRDDLVSPGVRTAPAYNRLYWNYTRGINSGEAIYALNYNIHEKIGSETADGVIDEADAQRMFPQGHGDAYGHYLTALKGYYKLLTNENFTWTPRAEAVTVLGQPVTIDYFDERKFAAAAGNAARTAEQVVSLTYRKYYEDDPAAGWTHLRDDQGANSQTGITRRQGLDEWVSRSAQGTLFHWAVANALLPEEDLVNTGIQKIDRTTVPEVKELPTYAAGFQTTIDNANARLNPLGLSPGAIAFDISPADMKAGHSHFEQVYERALVSLNNAAGAFNQAAVMTGLLRTQQVTLDEFNNAIFEEEDAFEDELIALFGRPYSGDVGPGKLYEQGYEGPDFFRYFIVDRPSDLVDTSQTFTVTIQEANEFSAFTGNRIDDIVNGLDEGTAVTSGTYTVKPSSFVQYNDVWRSGGLGSRPETGAIQDALLDAQMSWLALKEASVNYQKENANLRQMVLVFNDLVAKHGEHIDEMSDARTAVIALESVKLALETAETTLDFASDAADDLGDTLAEFFPRSVGLATDATSGARGAAKVTGDLASKILKGLAIASGAAAGATSIGVLTVEKDLEIELEKLGFAQEEMQFAYEFSTAYRDFTSHANEFMQLAIEHQRAVQNVANVLGQANRVLADREIYRQRAASIIQGYRTRDVSFRLFRNEALEQYRSLYDLASRYTYLAAKSYDYETGLLGTTQGEEVFNDIVASRSLGDLTGGVPQLTTSTIGDGGLAGSMAQLNADFSVAEGRLGINNPDQNGTLFSFRTELYRLMNDPSITSDDAAWRQTLEQQMVANVLADEDVVTHCRNISKPDGSPVPGIIIPFSSTIEHGRNFFGLELAAGDHAYTPTNFATKIYSVGVVLPGYVGMDSYATGNPSGAPSSGAPDALSATPYVYLIPCGSDFMLAPPLGDSNTVRSWMVDDQALPLPFNLGANDFNETQFFNANGTLSEEPWILRKHQAFRPVDDPTVFYSRVPAEFTNSRLIGRSVWNGQWKLVIPAYTLLNDEQEGLDRFAASVADVQLFLRTYSNSGN